MQVSSISPIQIKSMYKSKINSRQISNQYFEPNNYQSVPNYNNTCFKGINEKVILRILYELGESGAKLIKEYKEQISLQDAPLIKACLTIPTTLEFLRTLYKEISHPIATTNHSIAQERIPVYIELAKYNDKYRFTDEKIRKQLQEQFDSYMTEMDKIELLQELLKIGTKNEKPLTAEEISDFLKLTSGQTKEGQEKVIRYIKYSRDVLNFKPRERKSLEEFEREFEKDKLLYPWIAESSSPLKRYNAEYHLYSSKFSKEILTRPKGFDPLSFIASSQIPEANNVIKQICASENPEKVADLVHEIGMSSKISKHLRDLEEINEIVNNPPFIELLSELYYNKEIANIKNALKKQVAKGVIYTTTERCETAPQNAEVININKIKVPTNLSGQNYDQFPRIRKSILKSLGINKDVKLDNLKLEPQPHVKIYGNFEGGKRR